jgi:NAD(P)-dependent dehydrogenase (short-subunit alcohol dehydrogenase family)
MEFNLSDKIIVITGATQGVGEAIARTAAGAKAKGLCLAGRNRERGEKIAVELTNNGCPTIFVPTELEKEGDCRSLMAKAQQRFGLVNGLVNAAALSERGTIEDTSIALWDKLFSINARAPFILMQEFTRSLKKTKQPGSIVNIITISSHGGQPYITAYCSSKGALAILTKNVAHALRYDKIRVNGINMGWCDTPGENIIQQKTGQPSDWLRIAEEKQPFGRLLKPKDVALLAVYLLSDSSEMMTGSLIDFDQNVIGSYE